MDWRRLWCGLSTHEYRYVGVQFGRRLERCQRCDHVRATPIGGAAPFISAAKNQPGGEIWKGRSRRTVWLFTPLRDYRVVVRACRIAYPHARWARLFYDGAK